MSVLVDILSGLFFAAGSFMCVTGGLGLLRFPDFFSRVHASSVTETLGSPLIIIGLMLQMGLSLDTLKLLFVILFVLATNPTASHAMARAALRGGQKPHLSGETAPSPPAGESSSKP